jgi:S1-C subfamily serine protease
MTQHPDPSSDPDATQTVEVQRYGPPPERHPYHPPDQAAPAWSSRAPAARPVTTPTRGALRAGSIVAIAVVAGIVSGGLSAVGVSNLIGERTQPQPTNLDDGQTVSNVTIDESSAIISAVAKVAPAVVTIQASLDGAQGTASGSGSGFIYDPDGFILTNKHVVEGASSLFVILDDGRTFEGEVYGIDTLTDLAIVKVDATDLPYAPIGTSAALEPGQLAIAIGNPLGDYANTVTTGVVSGVGREIRASNAVQNSSDVLRNLIQTDAAINPGNSGGPLVNSAGQVIGLNTAVSEGAQGLGFAIPIDVAKPIMDQAVDGRELERPWIGVFYTPVTPALAESEGLDVDSGALVGTADGTSPVFPGSPAEAAGLQDGDVIVALDGSEIGADSDLSMLMIPYSAGDMITLTVLRNGSSLELEVTLGVLPATP